MVRLHLGLVVSLALAAGSCAPSMAADDAGGSCTGTLTISGNFPLTQTHFTMCSHYFAGINAFETDTDAQGDTVTRVSFEWRGSTAGQTGSCASDPIHITVQDPAFSDSNGSITLQAFGGAGSCTAMATAVSQTRFAGNATATLGGVQCTSGGCDLINRSFQLQWDLGQ